MSRFVLFVLCAVLVLLVGCEKEDRCGQDKCNFGTWTGTTCEWQVNPDAEGRQCLPDNPCHENFTCHQGKCEGQLAVDCDDANDCTKDRCYIADTYYGTMYADCRHENYPASNRRLGDSSTKWHACEGDMGFCLDGVCYDRVTGGVLWPRPYPGMDDEFEPPQLAE